MSVHGIEIQRHFLLPFSGYKNKSTVGKGGKDTEKFDYDHTNGRR
jgi:hypothetical protein